MRASSLATCDRLSREGAPDRADPTEWLRFGTIECVVGMSTDDAGSERRTCRVCIAGSSILAGNALGPKSLPDAAAME